MAKVRNHKTYIDDRGSFTPIDLQCGPKSIEKWLQANISVNPEIYTLCFKFIVCVKLGQSFEH